MKLSTKGRYAVMAMVDLASRGPGRPVALADIAQRQEISLSYLEQLFAKLRRGGARDQRARAPRRLPARVPCRQLRIADIILAVDEPIKATRCQAKSSKGCTGASAAASPMISGRSWAGRFTSI